MRTITERDIKPPFNLLGQKVIAVIGPTSVKWEEDYPRIRRIILNLPPNALIISRGTEGVDEMVRAACRELHRPHKILRPAWEVSAYERRTDPQKISTWYAVRNMLVPLKAHEVVVVYGSRPDSWVTKIVKSTRKHGVPLTEHGMAEHPMLFELVPQPKPPRKRPLIEPS